MYKMNDDDPLPKLLRDMERDNDMDNGFAGFFSALVMVAVVCVVCLAVSGCAVSLSFQPAKWDAPSSIQSGAKQNER